jgi:hypothetical protein
MTNLIFSNNIYVSESFYIFLPAELISSIWLTGAKSNLDIKLLNLIINYIARFCQGRSLLVFTRV